MSDTGTTEYNPAEHAARMTAIGSDIERVMEILDRTHAESGGNQLAVLLAAEMVRVSDPATLRHLAAAYAIAIAQKDREIAALTREVGKLRRHRHSIKIMGRNLHALWPFQWRRRQNIEHQLACIALALVEVTE